MAIVGMLIRLRSVGVGSLGLGGVGGVGFLWIVVAVGLRCLRVEGGEGGVADMWSFGLMVVGMTIYQYLEGEGEGACMLSLMYVLRLVV